MKQDIVIAGISGRFPESGNIDEFWTNLITGVDMVTEDDRRWSKGYAALPLRKGTVKNSLEEFDAEFFNINRKQAERLDPRLRQLLEVTWEAIFDSGTNPSELRGHKVGVYVGMSSYDTFEAARVNPSNVTRYDITGSAGCMFANRVSFAFDFRGPSIVVDTYCSSSMTALHLATESVRHGECDAAVVAGINLLLNPLLSKQVQSIGVLAMDGKCKAFDASADGYVQSEAIAAIFITQKPRCRRIYAEIVNTMANADGHKLEGLTFPSRVVQAQLMREAYTEVRIKPEDVLYVEAHGTGTNAGDVEELNAIACVFCGDSRPISRPLLIGSTKSNMGHAEAASGIASVIKVVLAIQHGVIPANLHHNTPNPRVPALLDGKLKVVTAPTIVTGGLYGVCASGLGGANVHIVLRGEQVGEMPVSLKIPTLVPISGRTCDGVENALNKINLGNLDLTAVQLLAHLHQKSVTGHKARGFTIVTQQEGEGNSNFSKTENLSGTTRPLWFIFPGMGTQWAGMAKEIIEIDIIQKSIQKSGKILKNFDIDVLDLVVNQNEKGMQKYLATAFTVVGIALVDFIKSLDLSADGYIGHSAGEVLCAYYDKCWSHEEALVCQYYKDLSLSILEGSYAMASVGLSWDQAVASCPAGIYPACDNAPDNVTLAGPQTDLSLFLEHLHSQGIFGKLVPTSGKAFHSPYISDVAKVLATSLRQVVQGDRTRSTNWISTAIPNEPEDGKRAFNVEYILHQFLSTVRFRSALDRIPPNAVVLEVGTHSLFQYLLKKSLPPTVTVLPTMKRSATDNIKRLCIAVGSIFVEGFQPNFKPLMDSTRDLTHLHSKSSLASFVDWNHSQSYSLLDYMPKVGTKACTKVWLGDPDWEFLKGHVINDRILFPASGYLVLVWKAFACLLEKNWLTITVGFDNVIFNRATILTEDRVVEFATNIFGASGDFQVTECNSIVSCGKVRLVEVDFEPKRNICSETDLVLKKEDIYKDLRLRGYDYVEQFCRIEKSTVLGDVSLVSSQGDMITFIDALFQLSVFPKPVTTSGGVFVPTRLKYLAVNPQPLIGQKSEHIVVRQCTQTNQLSTVGVEMSGIRFTSTPRRQKTENRALIQDWSFEPYFDHENQRTTSRFFDVFKMCVDIVLENVTSKFLRVHEISNDARNCRWVVENLQEIVNLCPSRSLQVLTAEKEVDLVIFHDVESFQEVSPFLTQTLKRVKSFFLIVLKYALCQEDWHDGEWNLVACKISANHWFYLFKKNDCIYCEETAIPVSHSNYEWLGHLQGALQQPTSSSRIWLTSDITCGLAGMVNCLRKEPRGDLIRCLVSSEHGVPPQVAEFDLVMNIHDPSTKLYGSFRGIKLLLSQNTKCTQTYLDVLKPGDLSTVSWIEATVPAGSYCEVHYAPLNFRDIMLATGRLPPDAIPGRATSQRCLLGLEFSGLDLQGNRVMGVVCGQGLATHVESDPDWTWKVPETWSLVEAATMPVAYSTAYYALILRGNLQHGDSLLVTSATGGVGQAAIAIGLSLHCNIFATVGSPAKKEWLTKTFPQIPEDHIFSSQSTLFAQRIQELTDDKGVTVVLNSLSEEKLKAGLACVGIGGKFLELGKFDLFQNSGLGMEVFLKNISFHGILIDAIFDNIEEKRRLVTVVQNGIDSGIVKPLPATVFEPDQVCDAFRFMTSGRHIGKVMVRMSSSDSSVVQDFAVVSRTYFDAAKVYVVAGGLGGFGLEFVSWMVHRGAINVVILSRSMQLSGYQRLKLARWREHGAEVVIQEQNQRNVKEMVGFLKKIGLIAPIGGIFNLAMVLQDALVENQSETTFELVLKPKFVLTCLLDEASRTACLELDHFVVFSSVSSLYGNAGQTNYGYGNALAEGICRYRKQQGYPALAIAWGAIDDVGIVHERMRNRDTIAGTVPQALSSCLEVLDKVLHPEFSCREGVVSCMVIPQEDHVAQKTETGTLRQRINDMLGLGKGFDAKDASLGELGVDSLMIMEVQQMLEEATSEKLSLTQIKSLTWNGLVQMEQKRKQLAT